MDQMDDKFIRRQAEFECYGFSMQQFKLENKLITKITLRNCVENFKSTLIEKLKNANVSSETIEKLNRCSIIDEICLKIFKDFDTQFKEFDDLIDNTLSLSDNMIYHFDEVSESEEKFLNNEIQEQEMWYMQNKYMLRAMEAELEMHEKLEPLIQKEAKIVNALQQFLENNKNWTRFCTK